MSPNTMIAELQRSWNEHPEYCEDAFKDYVCFFVDNNDTSPTGCIFIEGFAIPISDYVLSQLDFTR